MLEIRETNTSEEIKTGMASELNKYLASMALMPGVKELARRVILTRLEQVERKSTGEKMK
jgi:hypothetical protein